MHVGMVGLPEVDKFDQQMAEDHNVVGLQIQMNDPVVLQIPQSQNHRKEEIHLAEQGQRASIEAGVLLQSGEFDEIHHDTVAIGGYVINCHIVSGQKHRRAVFDVLQYLDFVGVAAVG